MLDFFVSEVKILQKKLEHPAPSPLDPSKTKPNRDVFNKNEKETNV